MTVPMGFLFGLPVSMSIREVEGSNFQGHRGDLVYAQRNIQEGAFDPIDASPEKTWDINLEIWRIGVRTLKKTLLPLCGLLLVACGTPEATEYPKELT